MGIETIIGLAIAGAAAGAQTHASRQQARETKDAKRDQENEVLAQRSELSNETAQADATSQARLARFRQRASMGAAGGYDATIATSPLGLAASPAAPGAAPLKARLGD